MGEVLSAITVPDKLFSSSVDDEEKRTLRYVIRHAALFRLAIRGYTAKAAAKEVGCSPSFAQMVFNKPEFRRRVLQSLDFAHAATDEQWLQEKKSIGEQIEEKGQAAFDTLVSLLESENTSDQLRAKIASDLLDRNQQTATTHRSERVLKVESGVLEAAIGASNTMDRFIKEHPANLQVMRPKRVG